MNGSRVDHPSLADRQADLIAALVAAGPLPDGFDESRVAAARDALLRKRSHEVATAWPVLAGSIGPQWTVEFGRWASEHPPAGAYLDGQAFAHALAAAGRLPAAARTELRRRAGWLSAVRRYWRSTTRRW